MGTRKLSVVVPQHPKRQSCNSQPFDDEIGHATMNLVIAIDGRGSTTEKGVAILQNYAQGLLMIDIIMTPG
jgi:hypothetical protein